MAPVQVAWLGAGLALAWHMYIRNPQAPERLAQTHYPLYQFLLNKWYFDELYDLIFVRPAKAIGRFLWIRGDGGVIDRFGPDGIAASVQALTRRAVQLLRGAGIDNVEIAEHNEMLGDHYDPIHRRLVLSSRSRRARPHSRVASSREMAAGVTPGTRLACPTVAGLAAASFCRTSCDRPRMVA